MKLLTRLIVLCIGAASFLNDVCAANPYAAVVTSPDGELNVRQTPNAKGKIVAVLKSGEAVSVIESEAEWVTVKMADGSLGYVKTKYLVAKDAGKNIPEPQPTKETPPQLTGSSEPLMEYMAVVSSPSGSAEVHQGEWSDAKVVAILKNGERVNVFAGETAGGWVCLDDGPNGKKFSGNWMLAKFLRQVGKAWDSSKPAPLKNEWVL